MGERYPYKVDVVGSIPTSCTIMSRYSSGLRDAAATRIFVSSNLTLLSKQYGWYSSMAERQIVALVM